MTTRTSSYAHSLVELLGQAERSGTNGRELLVDVIDQASDLVVLGGCVHVRPPGSLMVWTQLRRPQRSFPAHCRTVRWRGCWECVREIELGV